MSGSFAGMVEPLTTALLAQTLDIYSAASSTTRQSTCKLSVRVVVAQAPGLRRITHATAVAAAHSPSASAIPCTDCLQQSPPACPMAPAEPQSTTRRSVRGSRLSPGRYVASCYRFACHQCSPACGRPVGTPCYLHLLPRRSEPAAAALPIPAPHICGPQPGHHGQFSLSYAPRLLSSASVTRSRFSYCWLFPPPSHSLFAYPLGGRFDAVRFFHPTASICTPSLLAAV